LKSSKLLKTFTFSRLATSAHKTVVEVEPLAQASLPQRLLARQERHDWELNFLENHLVFSLLSEHILAPSTGKASAVIENSVLRRKTYSVDVLLELDCILQEQKCDIIVESSLIVVLVDNQISDIVVCVRIKLVLGLSVPFAGANLKCWWVLALNTVSS
jgi:hypothetical protein